MVGNYRNMHGKPFIIRSQRFIHIADSVETPGQFPFNITLFRSNVSIMHLHLITLRRPALLLIGRMKIDTGIGTGSDHHIGPKFKVFEIGIPDRTGVKQMRTRTVRGDHPIFNSDGFGIFTGSPAVKRFAVEQRYPSILRRGSLKHPGNKNGHYC